MAGLAALAIPGVGPLLAGGALLAALTGLVAGTVTGGILGALIQAGVPEDLAHTYAARLDAGAVLVLIQTDRLTNAPVTQVLLAHGGEDVRG